MSKLLKVLVLLVGAVAMIGVGCNSDDTATVKSGTVTVMVGDSSKAIAGDVDVNVTFDRLALQNVSGEPSATLIETTQIVNVADETVLDSFDVPVGTYHCVSLAVSGVEVVEGENSCSGSLPGNLSLDFDQICLQSGLLRVDEDGTYTVLVDVPVINASCPVDGGAPSFSFGSPSMQIVE